MSVRELMRREKARRAAGRETETPKPEEGASFPQHEENKSLCGGHSVLPILKSSARHMTGYESDDEAENNSGETDGGSISSHTPGALHSGFHQRIRPRVEFESDNCSVEDSRPHAVKRPRFQDAASQSSVSLTSSIHSESHSPSMLLAGHWMPVEQDESADSGYEAGGEGTNPRRSYLNKGFPCSEKHGGDRSEGPSSSDVPVDFFDSSHRPPGSEGDREKTRVTWLFSVPKPKEETSVSPNDDEEPQGDDETGWLKRAFESENLRVEEEYYILDDENLDEGPRGENTVSNNKDTNGCYQSIIKHSPASFPQGSESVSDRVVGSSKECLNVKAPSPFSVSRGFEGDEDETDEAAELDEAVNVYRQTAQFSIQSDTVGKPIKSRNVVSDHCPTATTGETELPEGFFEDPEKDAQVRGGIAPRVRQERELHQEFKLFQRELEVIEQHRESLHHRKEVDKQLGMDEDPNTKVIQDFVTKMKQRKRSSDPSKRVTPAADSDNESWSENEDVDVNSLVEMSWRNRKVIK